MERADPDPTPASQQVASSLSAGSSRAQRPARRFPAAAAPPWRSWFGPWPACPCARSAAATAGRASWCRCPPPWAGLRQRCREAGGGKGERGGRGCQRVQAGGGRAGQQRHATWTLVCAGGRCMNKRHGEQCAGGGRLAGPVAGLLPLAQCATVSPTASPIAHSCARAGTPCPPRASTQGAGIAAASCAARPPPRP